MLGGLVSLRNVIQQKTMTSNTTATTTAKTTQTTKSTTKKKKQKQKTNNDHEHGFSVDLPWPLPEEHRKGAQESPKRVLRAYKSRPRDPQSAPRSIAGSKQSNLQACRRILRACRHSGTSRRAPKPRASRHLPFSEPQDLPQKSPNHDLSTMSTFYGAKRAGARVLGHRPSLPFELYALLSDFRSSRSSFGAPIVLFFEFCLIILVCGGCENNSILLCGS